MTRGPRSNPECGNFKAENKMLMDLCVFCVAAEQGLELHSSRLSA